MRIVVLGYVVRGPLGGMAWSDLHYVLGLRSLGHDVLFLEDSDDHPCCYDPLRGVTGTDPTYGLRFAGRLFRRFGLGDRWAYFDAHANAWHGPAGADGGAAFRGADVVLNLAGVNPLRPWVEAAPNRVFVDKDPGFTQARIAADPWAADRASGHTAFLTFAANVGRSRSRLPDDGLTWRPTRHPIALEHWPAAPPRASGRWTTVMQWDSYPARTSSVGRLGTKADSFDRVLDLPGRTPVRLELAVAGAPRERLVANGWHVRDPAGVAGDPWAYRAYLRGSRGEFAVAKQGYVATRCGWFSERSASYLASGRPVVTEDTGFPEWLPTGAGVLAFSTADAARAALDEVESNYEHHCRAARAVAEELFDAGIVLEDMLRRAQLR